MLYIEQGTGCYFCRNTDSGDDNYKILPSLLPNHLIISLTHQENGSRKQKIPLGTISAGFVPHIQPTALQDEVLMELEKAAFNLLWDGYN